MTTIWLTDTYGDPVLVNWNNVQLAEEIRDSVYSEETQTSTRKFKYTKIHFVEGGKNAVAVKENLPTINRKLGLPEPLDDVL